MKHFVPIVLILAACASLRPSDPSAVVGELVSAFNRLDAAAVESLFTEEATAFLPMPDAAAFVRGRSAIVAALAPLFTAERARHPGGGPEYLHLVAKDVAVRTYGRAAVVTFDVGSGELHSRRTLVLVWRDGRWKIDHLHASNVRTP
jgi:uncharacterized protein (TIGR02246 family)